ncbi:MAG: hypothetical protein ACK56F_16370, partial [bacterium]
SLSQSLWGEGAKSYYWLLYAGLVLYNPMTTVLSAWSQSNNQRARISEIYGEYQYNLHRGATMDRNLLLKRQN